MHTSTLDLSAKSLAVRLVLALEMMTIKEQRELEALALVLTGMTILSFILH